MKSQHLNRRSPWSNKVGGSASFTSYNRSLEMLHNNDSEAFALNQRAAEQGMHDAILAMGWFYLNGVGVEADEEEAVRWYRRSARQGDPRAMFSLGYIAYVSRDFTEALKWFTRADEKRHDRSKYWIAKMYWRGQGVDQDRRRAKLLFSQAASKKVNEAQRTVRFLSFVSRTN